MKETTNHKLRFPEGTDPAKIAEYFANLAEDTERELDDIAPSQIASAGAGDEAKILVVQNTGAPAFKALSGDVTVNAAGVVEIGAGKVGTSELADKGVTTAKINNEAVTDSKLAKPILALQVAGTGEVLLGSGAAVTRISAGVYEIELAKELDSAVIAIPSLAGSAAAKPVRMRAGNATKSSVRITIEDATSAAVDHPFNVMLKAS